MQAPRYDLQPSPASSVEVWAPAICSSPLHSGGLSMENPFEMFDEVGRSLKWFSISKIAPEATILDHQNNKQACVEEIASRDSFDSDSSSTTSWNRHSVSGLNDHDDDDADDDDDEQELCRQGSSMTTDRQCGRVPETIHVSKLSLNCQKPRIEEIFDDGSPWSKEEPVCTSLDDQLESQNGNVQHLPKEHCLNRDPITGDTSKDPVSGLVRSFFSTRQDAYKKPDLSRQVVPEKKTTDILALEKKIEILESENARFKRESQRINKILKEKEEGAARFAQERAAWEKQNLAKMEAFYSEKEELLQELKREKRVLEKRLLSMPQLLNSLPNKAERREIADLKAKLMDVHEEHLKKEARLRLTNMRLRKLVKELSGRLNEKQEEIKRYERLLMQWDSHTQESDKRVKSKSSLEDVDHLNDRHGCKTIKVVECSSADGAAVGCRITGAFFRQRPDVRGKQKKEMNCKESSSILPDMQLANASESSSEKMPSYRTKKKKFSELGIDDDVASTDGTAVVEEADGDCVSDVLIEDATQSHSNGRKSPVKETPNRGSQRRSMIFTDGTREEEYQDGLACVYFPNGDIKNSLADGTTEYYYSEIDTWHTTKPDGVEIFYFPHNQIEEHWPDGRRRVIFPDGTSSFMD